VDEGEARMMTVLAKSDSFAHAFTFIGDNQHLMWDKTVAHLKLSFASVAVAILIAVPLGVWLGHLHKGSFFAINISNILVALVILAGPVILTNAYVAVDQVDRNAVQAAYAMGMKQWQVLLRVEIPLALPLIFAGIRTATVYVVATATLATFAGGGGLGDIIVNQASYGVSGVVAGSLFITILAFLIDGILALVQRFITPAPLRPKWGMGRRAQQVRAATESI
jgi:osmoprotectant transport system permease protein